MFESNQDTLKAVGGAGNFVRTFGYVISLGLAVNWAGPIMVFMAKVTTFFGDGSFHLRRRGIPELRHLLSDLFDRAPSRMLYHVVDAKVTSQSSQSVKSSPSGVWRGRCS